MHQAQLTGHILASGLRVNTFCSANEQCSVPPEARLQRCLKSAENSLKSEASAHCKDSAFQQLLITDERNLPPALTAQDQVRQQRKQEELIEEEARERERQAELLKRKTLKTTQAKAKEEAAKVLEQGRLQQERENSKLLVELLRSRDRREQADWVVKVLASARKGQIQGRPIVLSHPCLT